MMNKALSVLAVVAILGASFLAGQKSFAVVEYEHTDVVNAASSCGAKTYVGGCTDCQKCPGHKYSAGGCSYFKDTLCTLCTVIDHCPTANIVCASEYDEKCTKCDPSFWVDESKASSCQACTVCGADEYVTKVCGQFSDTVCESCSECGDSEWVSRVCKMDPDSDPLQLLEKAFQGVNLELDTGCTAKLPCKEGDFCSEEFVPGSIHEMGAATQCEKCEACLKTEYASASCTIAYQGQTECTDCSECTEGEEYISKQCLNGNPFDKTTNAFVRDTTGDDTECTDCTARPEGSWTVFPCNSLHTSDAVHAPCSTCQPGQYQLEECTEFADTVCPACPDSADTISLGDPDFASGLQYCKMAEGTERSMLHCEAVTSEDGTVTARASFCGEWTDVKVHDQRKCRPEYDDKSNCGAWKGNCKDGYSGKSCCYHKHNANCGTLTTRERSGERNGFNKGTSEIDGTAFKFTDFCQDLCDEFPDCMAFEVLANPDPDGDPSCFFKAAYTQNEKRQWMANDDTWDCYSNTCRQNNYVSNPDTINYTPGASKDATRLSSVPGGRRR